MNMDRRLRIAMLSVHTCPLATLGGKETGGMNVYVRDLSRELARRGHHVDVYTRSQDPGIPHASRQLGRGARLFHVPAGPEHPYDKNLVYDHVAEFVDGVLAQVEADGIRYDVIHSHYWLSGAAAWALRERWGTPIVHMFHTLGRMKNAVAQRSHERETERRIAVETDIVRFADALVAATPAEEKQLIRLYGADRSRIRVISPAPSRGSWPGGLSCGMGCVCPSSEATLIVSAKRMRWCACKSCGRNWTSGTWCFSWGPKTRTHCSITIRQPRWS